MKTGKTIGAILGIVFFTVVVYYYVKEMKKPNPDITGIAGLLFLLSVGLYYTKDYIKGEQKI